MWVLSCLKVFCWYSSSAPVTLVHNSSQLSTSSEGVFVLSSDYTEGVNVMAVQASCSPAAENVNSDCTLTFMNYLDEACESPHSTGVHEGERLMIHLRDAVVVDYHIGLQEAHSFNMVYDTPAKTNKESASVSLELWVTPQRIFLGSEHLGLSHWFSNPFFGLPSHKFGCLRYEAGADSDRVSMRLMLFNTENDPPIRPTDGGEEPSDDNATDDNATDDGGGPDPPVDGSGTALKAVFAVLLFFFTF
eukprot:Trichotokara_eunicae@DN6362_c0_g1_i1.p1